MPGSSEAPQTHICPGLLPLAAGACLQVVAVDPSVQPPSNGIEIDGGYRETEATRLAPLPEAEQETQQHEGQQEAVAVEGLGHRDAATEAKEAAARQLEE